MAAELAEIDARPAAQIDAANAVMTLAELAEFTGIRKPNCAPSAAVAPLNPGQENSAGQMDAGRSTTRTAWSRRGAAGPLPADTDTHTDAVAAAESA